MEESLTSKIAHLTELLNEGKYWKGFMDKPSKVKRKKPNTIAAIVNFPTRTQFWPYLTLYCIFRINYWLWHIFSPFRCYCLLAYSYTEFRILTSSVLMPQKCYSYQNGVEFHLKVIGAIVNLPTEFYEQSYLQSRSDWSSLRRRAVCKCLSPPKEPSVFESQNCHSMHYLWNKCVLGN